MKWLMKLSSFQNNNKVEKPGIFLQNQIFLICSYENGFQWLLMLFTLQFHSPPLQLPRCWECCAQVGGKHLNIEDLKSKSVIKVVGSRPTTPPEPSLSCDGAILEQRHMSQRRTYPYSLFFKRLLGSLGACSRTVGNRKYSPPATYQVQSWMSFMMVLFLSSVSYYTYLIPHQIRHRQGDWVSKRKQIVNSEFKLRCVYVQIT